MTILASQPEEKRLFGKLRCKLEAKTNVDGTTVGKGAWTGFIRQRIWTLNINEPLSS
jgi:hypothetical protein